MHPVFQTKLQFTSYEDQISIQQRDRRNAAAVVSKVYVYFPTVFPLSAFVLQSNIWSNQKYDLDNPNVAYTSIVSTVVANANDQANSPIKIKEHHCVKSVRLWSYSGPYFPSFRLNTERYGVSFRNQSECGKIRTRITPNTFHAVYSQGFFRQSTSRNIKTYHRG